MNLTSERVLAWRMHRQFLDRPAGLSTVAVVERLCGIQAQVAGCAEQAVAARQASPHRGGVAEALADKTIIKTWAMRGTLHLLAADTAAAYLSLLAAPRTWEKGAWQRSFATAAQVEAIAGAAQEALAGAVLTREQLTDEIVRRTGDASLLAELTSGWGAVLKPLAWQGYLINGPSEGSRVTFTSPRTWLPGWTGLPAPDDAARVVIPAYLGAFGPSSMETFDQWLLRGASKKAFLKSWFAGLVDDGVLTPVEVDGASAYARAEDVEEIAATKPSTQVRLLDAFDQYVMGPGTANTQIIAAHRRKDISRAAGWIAPVVVHAGRVAGTWEVADTALTVTLFPEAGKVPSAGIEAEAVRIGTARGATLRVSVLSG
jgi:hypothetical protein